MLSPDRSGLAWCVIDGIAVFLDTSADRYFRLPETENERFFAAVESDLAGPHQPALFPLHHSWEPPLRRSSAMEEGPFRLGDVAAALWMQRRVERRLATHSFEQMLIELSTIVAARSPANPAESKRTVRNIRAFQLARLLRSAADRCLPRSIALALCLARHQCRVHVVLGVKLAPFAAHCWVQSRDEVLNDEMEEVRRYTPILVL